MLVRLLEGDLALLVALVVLTIAVVGTVARLLTWAAEGITEWRRRRAARRGLVTRVRYGHARRMNRDED